MLRALVAFIALTAASGCGGAQLFPRWQCEQGGGFCSCSVQLTDAPAQTCGQPFDCCIRSGNADPTMVGASCQCQPAAVASSCPTPAAGQTLTTSCPPPDNATMQWRCLTSSNDCTCQLVLTDQPAVPCAMPFGCCAISGSECRCVALPAGTSCSPSATGLPLGQIVAQCG